MGQISYFVLANIFTLRQMFKQTFILGEDVQAYISR